MKTKQSITWELSVFVIFLLSCCVYSSSSNEVGEFLTYKEGYDMESSIRPYKLKQTYIPGTYVFKSDKLSTGIKKIKKVIENNKKVIEELVNINKKAEKVIKRLENAKVQKGNGKK